jgi:hypothetical protein
MLKLIVIYHFCLIFSLLLNILETSEFATINNIPHNEEYRFKVSVYNISANDWSDFSDLSNIVNTTVGKLTKLCKCLKINVAFRSRFYI